MSLWLTSPPARIDKRETHRLKRCPCCGGPLQRCARKRTRTIEDIPEEIQPVVTEHTIHRDYCPKCKKDVEPVVPDALPGATLGALVQRFWTPQILPEAPAATLPILPIGANRMSAE